MATRATLMANPFCMAYNNELKICLNCYAMACKIYEYYDADNLLFLGPNLQL